jgi:glucose/arabinose dehydrogenase
MRSKSAGILLLVVAIARLSFADAVPDQYYELSNVKPPDNSALEVGGMAFNSDNSLVISTRRGEIWTLKNNQWTRFASGLQEPLGLIVGDTGEVFVMQRSELTRIVDTDNDGHADRFEKISDAFGYSGNYHEYAYGPVRDNEGNFYVTLNLSHAPDAWGGPFMGAAAKYRGWCLQMTPKGEMIPFASGLRSPNGLCMSPDGDIFATDNQGEFNVTNVLHHIQKGRFYGHPSSLSADPSFKGSPKTTSVEELDKMRTRPVIYFPYDRMGKSISEPRFDTTGGKFGPFAGQMFLGDISNRLYMRAQLDKVDGQFQGACFPFLAHDDLVGANREAFAPDGALYVGITNRGWGKGTMGLRQIKWTGKMPFEIQKIELAKDGFNLTFTKPLDPATGEKSASYAVQHYGYKYENKYGGPEVNRTAVKDVEITLSADKKVVHLKLAEVIPLKVYEIRIPGVKSADGNELRNNIGWYTVNRLKQD